MDLNMKLEILLKTLTILLISYISYTMESLVQVEFCRSCVGYMCYQPCVYIQAVQFNTLKPDWS
jgi:hypothetical protein